jgi:hypothetical protein
LRRTEPSRDTSLPFSVLMGLMPCRPDNRPRGRDQADSLSEVLHRP